MVAYFIVRLYQVLLHNEYVGKLGWIESILCTPSAHRVHHARNEQYLDKNYGGITIIWDRIFGTYCPETSPVEYGLVKQLNSNNLIWINFHEFVKIGQDLAQAKTWRERWHYFWGKPGWTPSSIESVPTLSHPSFSETLQRSGIKL